MAIWSPTSAVSANTSAGERAQRQEFGHASARSTRVRAHPRRVTGFAERVEQTGAAQPQKQAGMHARPRRSVVRSFTFASPPMRGHAVAAGVCRGAHVSLGQLAPAPRKPQRNDMLLMPAAGPCDAPAAPRSSPRPAARHPLMHRLSVRRPASRSAVPVARRVACGAPRRR